MKVLITGGDGQLAKAFREFWKNKDAEVVSLNKSQMNIIDEQSVRSTIIAHHPDLVLHCAAYTAVERAEEEASVAFNVNALGSSYVAKACEKIKATFVYISTDYVFDGTKRTPYEVTDEENPLNIYGLSKWMGEKLVLAAYPETFVVRTSWLYGHGGKNFVNTMRKMADSGERIKVICEQWGTPTYVDDLVEAVYHLTDKEPGIYQYSNMGVCSWFEFAQEIYYQAGADPEFVQPKTLAEYVSAANRPQYTVLSKSKFVKQTGITPTHWKKALRHFFQKETK